MTSTAAQLARTEEERRYYALEDRAWRVLAPVYDAIVFPLRRMRQRVARLADVQPGMQVLDVATGTGAQAIAFADAGAEVTAVDLSAAMLRVARRKVGRRTIVFREGDARALPFRSGSFDRAGISFGLHEMPPSVRREALRELARVTKADGRVVIVDYALPRGRFARWVVYHVVKLYERDSYAEFVRSDLHAMLDEAGLIEVADDRPAIRWWSPVVVVIARNRA